MACRPDGSCSMQGDLQVKAGLSSMVTFAPDGSVKNCTVLSAPGFPEVGGGMLETSRRCGGSTCAGAWAAGSLGVSSAGLVVSGWVVSGFVVSGFVVSG